MSQDQMDALTTFVTAIRQVLGANESIYESATHLILVLQNSQPVEIPVQPIHVS
jgi:hypothetical protein